MQESEIERPNYSNSDSLLKDVNTVAGIVLKYSEPLDARKTTDKLRLYVYKDKKELEILFISHQSAYLIGREPICDVPVQHPSCSKQHAALQYRLRKNGEVLLYIIDLDSVNGTFVNGTKIPCSRYYQLLVGDVLKFGSSTREYVLIQEQ